MSAADAQCHWVSAAIPDDQFLLYCFADPGVALDCVAQTLRRNAARVPDLCLRVLEVPGSLDRPYWIAAPPDVAQVIIHREVGGTWQSCLDRLAELMDDQLDATRHAWRLHLFGPIADPPAGEENAIVVVLQISHALGDGRRTSAIARELFTGHALREPSSNRADLLGPRVLGPAAAGAGLAAFPWQVAHTLVRGVLAYRAVRGRPTAPPRPGASLTRLNRPPGSQRTVRTIVGPRTMLPATHTVTVGAMTAISVALSQYLDAPVPAAELTVARPGEPKGRNHFRNVGIDLHPDVDDLADRAQAIADEVARARGDADDPVRRAQRRAADASPPILTHWGTRRFDPYQVPAAVTGVTVVSSVYRGPADLHLDGGRVIATAGFPALSPAQGLTHGVHGIGDTVTLSVTTSPDIMPDADRYRALLRSAIDVVRESM